VKLTPIAINIADYPSVLQPFLDEVAVYDSSCSPDAKVLFVDKDEGYFIKSAQKGSLKRDTTIMRYFFDKGLSANVLAYICDDCDYLLTQKIPGDDCTTAKYLEQPERLAETIAERLAILHSLDFADCPMPNHTERYLARAEGNCSAGFASRTCFPAIGALRLGRLRGV
jgi:kanamycin kinase